MPRRREIPKAWGRELDGHEGPGEEPEPLQLLGHGSTRPWDELEALMMAAPHTVPDTPQRDLLPLRDILQDAIDRLSVENHWIFDALITRRLSERQLVIETEALAEAGMLPRALPRRTIRRRRDEMLAALRVELSSHPLIAEYLE